MAQILGDNINDIQMYGEYGNCSIADGGKTLAAAAIADTVDLIKLDGPVRILDAHMINAALGAATTVSLGWRYSDGTAGGSATAILAATGTVAAARTNTAAAPIQPSLQKGITIYATVGGGVATGRLDAVVKYRALGGK